MEVTNAHRLESESYGLGTASIAKQTVNHINSEDDLMEINSNEEKPEAVASHNEAPPSLFSSEVIPTVANVIVASLIVTPSDYNDQLSSGALRKSPYQSSVRTCQCSRTLIHNTSSSAATANKGTQVRFVDYIPPMRINRGTQTGHLPRGYKEDLTGAMPQVRPRPEELIETSDTSLHETQESVNSEITLNRSDHITRNSTQSSSVGVNEKRVCWNCKNSGHSYSRSTEERKVFCQMCGRKEFTAKTLSKVRRKMEGFRTICSENGDS